MKNWKTSFLGVLSIATIGVKLANGGSISNEDIGVIIAGVGLLLAKDHNVTGGTKQQ